MSEQEKFIKAFKAIKEYWMSLLDKSTEDIVDGVMFSILVMIDGDSAVNDFHRLQIKDSETGKRIDCGYLHELLFKKE